MGNEIDVFAEGELEESFWKLHGPKNESVGGFFSRSFSDLMKMLTQPKRLEYSLNELQTCSEDDPPCIVDEFVVRNGETCLQCAAWMHDVNSKLCVLYLHTNTRALVDAKEVLPFCNELGANLIAFDLPGCGKSGGHLSFSMVKDLSAVVDYIMERYEYNEVIIWARGMSTAIAIEYCSKLNLPKYIKFVVLDSPFISVKQMVKDATQSVTAYGVHIPQRALLLCASVIRKTLRSRLGSDPYAVVPMDFVPGLKIPGHVLSALEDDYMPPHHGRAIAGLGGKVRRVMKGDPGAVFPRTVEGISGKGE
eukprot:CAMPEP_0185029052 /NCGR_PEP_ID=MMETSP1103-20130426/15135_1 /TAXON_ID=36769 /ORGANISM="Paraphysomonas bandaiensis, Strain Caron Lab Isolate" /LENGTH=306 /DNA_ID=CAMNT_0027563665 /DNA_START=70 /DNA_END=991 /DNA_ORIENTATION=+